MAPSVLLYFFMRSSVDLPKASFLLAMNTILGYKNILILLIIIEQSFKDDLFDKFKNFKEFNMTSIHSLTHPLTDMPQVFKNGFRTLGILAGRAVKIVQNLPQHMQNNRNLTIVVFTTANAVLFTMTNLFVNRLDKHIENPGHGEELKADERRVKNIFLNYGVVSVSFLAFNVILAKATRYPLSNVALAAITTTAIALRLLLNLISVKNEKQVEDKKEIDKEEKKLQEELTPEAKEKELEVEKEKKNEEKKQEAEEIEMKKEDIRTELRRRDAEYEQVDREEEAIKDKEAEVDEPQKNDEESMSSNTGPTIPPEVLEMISQ